MNRISVVSEWASSPYLIAGGVFILLGVIIWLSVK